MAKQLKIWNGRGHGRKYSRGHVYVAAYTQKQAAELVSKACFGEEYPDLVSVNEIRTYYSSGSWGNPMNGIEPTEPCVYIQETSFSNEKPVRII
jgi:hypothetical protein